jgi:hypothetical protein
LEFTYKVIGEKMLPDSVLTAFFLGFFWAVFKVVEYLVTRKKKNTWGKEQERKLNELHAALAGRLRDQEKFISTLEEILNSIDENIRKLNEMHCVYDENLIPRWYLPPDVPKIIRQMNSMLESFSKEIEDGFGEARENQTVLSGRLIDLISSQKLMVERMADLINRLNRITTN